MISSEQFGVFSEDSELTFGVVKVYLQGVMIRKRKRKPPLSKNKMVELGGIWWWWGGACDCLREDCLLLP